MLNVIKVIADITVATSKPIPDGIGHLFDVIPNIIPRIAPINPNIIKVLPAAVLVVVLVSAIDDNPAAQAPEQTAEGRPNTPPIMPKTIGAFDVPLTFDIFITP